MLTRLITLGLTGFLALALPLNVDAVQCGSAERFGTILIRSGDSERRVLQAGPDRTVRLETREGGAAGFRHDFYRSSVTVQVYVRAGVVTEICRIRG